jgi:hypothetical protein
MHIIIGIDPGLDGALVTIKDGMPDEVFDTPTNKIVVDEKNRREYDLVTIRLILSGLRDDKDVDRVTVVLEKVGPMATFAPFPKCKLCHRGPTRQAATSMFSMGAGYGIWQGMLAGMQIPYELIHPRSWKSKMIPTANAGKDASRQVASRLWPKWAAKHLTMKMDHGRADAALMAEHFRRINSVVGGKDW